MATLHATFLDLWKEKLGFRTVEQWLTPLQWSEEKKGVLRLVTQDPFVFEWFQQQIAVDPLLNTLMWKQQSWRVECLYKSSQSSSPPSHAPSPTFTLSSDLTELPIEDLWLEYQGNALATRVCAELIQAPDKIAEQKMVPLYLYSCDRSGVSTLMRQAARRLEKLGYGVLYVKGQTFTHHLVQAIRLGHMHAFRDFYRQPQVLFFDGVEHLAHKQATQEEFFHTFNALHGHGKIICLGARSPAHDLKGIEPRLVSRFEAGLALPLVAPTAEESRDLFDHQMALLNLQPSAGLRTLLLSYIESNLPIFNKLIRLCKKKGSNIYSMTPEAWAAYLTHRNTAEARLEKRDLVLLTVATHYEITIKDLLGKSQKQPFSLPRHIAMYLCRHLLDMSFPAIAELFGRNHSTVMASCKRIEKERCISHSQLAQDINLIQEKLKG